MKKIAVVEFHHETNSFSPVLSSLADFEQLGGIHIGESLWTRSKEINAQMEGFQKAVKEFGKGQFEIIPVFLAWAVPGGPLKKEVYDYFRNLLIDFLDQHEDLDGFYMSLHGAMGVEDNGDPESDFIGLVREKYGPDFPIGVSYDMHANVTKANIDLATFIYGYKTNPHRDHRDVGYQSGKILINAILGKVKPVMTFLKLPILKGGGLGVDFLPPLRGIIRAIRKMEKQDKVLSVSIFMVHLWIDHPETGWSVVIVTDGDPDLGAKVAEKVAHLKWEIREKKHPEPITAGEAIDKAKAAWLRRRLGTLMFCDVSDVVGAGGPGENTHILSALMEKAPELKSFVPVRDEESVTIVWEKEIGESVELEVGAKIEKVYNQTVLFSGKLIHKTESQWGKAVIILWKGIHLLLTERAFAGYFPQDYLEVGLNLWKADITVVKNLFPFRYKFLKYNRGTFNIATSGITNLDVHSLEYEHIPRPIYPLDDLDGWR